jgi:hypothetical protein
MIGVALVFCPTAVGEAEDIVVAKPVMAAEGGFFVHLLILFWVYWYSGISVY